MTLDEHKPIAEDDHSERAMSDSPLILSVAVPRPFPGALSYLHVGDTHFEDLLGSWVLVPLSSAHVMGCVIDLSFESSPSSKLKPISAELHWVPPLPVSLVKLIKYVSHYYHVPIGETIKLVMPKLISRPSDMLMPKRVSAEQAKSHSNKDKTAELQLSLSLDCMPVVKETARPISSPLLEVLSRLNSDGPLSYSELPFYVERREWSAWHDNRQLKRLKLPHNPTPSEIIWTLKRPKEDFNLPKRRVIAHEIIDHLHAVGSSAHDDLLKALSPRKKSKIKENLRELIESESVHLHLRSKSSVSIQTFKPQGDPTLEEVNSLTKIELTPEQKVAVEGITSHDGFKVTLLHGVTGSGKTEVYLEVIERVLHQGKQALVLIPEIGLTPQTVSRFKHRLRCPIYSWHSKMGPRERLQTWQTLSNEGPCVLIGARSALFCPLSSLGAIIVDESHDSSYKQGDGLRYHARDMSVMRGSFEDCPVILGTATPSLESMYNALNGKFNLITLKERPRTASLPSVRVIDLTKSRSVTQEATSITHVLAQAIAERLKRGEQSILFLNRRGFSQSIRCVGCGFVFACPHCLLPLPWHLSRRQLQCHHCDFSAESPSSCPSCCEATLAPIGRGTEKIEQQLLSLFPRAKIARLDQDSKLSAEELHQLMHSDQVDILIGTQMVTKGHDFPRVTLVGVIDADVGIDLPDFRANERSFQLLSQVSGRAGRADLTGEVIIQSYRPKEERLLAAISHDYLRFFSHELRLRETISYPPFGYLATIRLKSAPGESLTRALEKMTALTSTLPSSIRSRGPSLAPITMNNGAQRWILTLSSTHRQALHRELKAMAGTLLELRASGIHCLIDVDPQDFS